MNDQGVQRAYEDYSIYCDFWLLNIFSVEKFFIIRVLGGWWQEPLEKPWFGSIPPSCTWLGQVYIQTLNLGGVQLKGLWDLFLSSCGGGLTALFMTGDGVQWQLSQVAREVFSNDSGSFPSDHVFALHFACFVSLILQASYWASELTNIFLQ